MVTSQRDIEAEAQFQNEAPIGPQVPFPAGIHNMVISWDRNQGYMSVRVGNGRWHFKEMLGKAVITDTNNEVGRIHIRAKGELHGERLILWRPGDIKPHPMVKGVRRPTTLNRLCYLRAGQSWRWRDEHMDWNNPDALKIVKGYVGDWQIEWDHQDPIAHLFHQGFGVLCGPGCFMHEDGGYGHFYDTDRWNEAE